MERVVLKEQLDELRALFIEYANDLGFSLCFQGFDEELARLPAGYLALLVEPGQGCVGLRTFDATTAEMKRLYVRPGARGKGLGRKLAIAAIEQARVRSYERVVLDTIRGKMDPAITLYRTLGFCEIAPYYENPIFGALYLELRLR